ncbi:MAG: hypothetical protein ACR2QW_10310 [bacterium]
MKHADRQLFSTARTFTKSLILGMLIFSTLVAIVAFQVSSPAHAEPKMWNIESTLEGTSVYRMRVNKAGKGIVVLHCYTCPRERIRLKVTPGSFAVVAGEKVPLSTVGTGGDRFMTGFYNADTMELTRLKVE